MTRLLFRLELLLEVFFLSSFAVVAVGLRLVSPAFTPFAHFLTEMGVPFAIMRRGWGVGAVVYLLGAGFIATYPGGGSLLLPYLVSVAIISLLTGWSIRTKQPASRRLVITVVAILLAQVATLALHSDNPLTRISSMVGWNYEWLVRHVAGLPSATALTKNLWPLYWVAENSVWGTLLYLLWTHSARFYGIGLSVLPRFGTWTIPKGLWATSLVIMMGIFGELLLHWYIGWQAVVAIGLAVGYAVYGLNVLWAFLDQLHVHFTIRIILTMLLLMAGYVGFVGLVIVGALDGLWQFRDYIGRQKGSM